MAIIRYMEIHQRTPYLFKTIYEIYVEMNVKFIKSAGVGSVFNYSKNVLERAVRRLEDLRILELEDDYESIWNAQIKSAMTHLEIEQCFRNMNSLPNFVICILESWFWVLILSIDFNYDVLIDRDKDLQSTSDWREWAPTEDPLSLQPIAYSRRDLHVFGLLIVLLSLLHDPRVPVLPVPLMQENLREFGQTQ